MRLIAFFWFYVTIGPFFHFDLRFCQINNIRNLIFNIHLFKYLNDPTQHNGLWSEKGNGDVWGTSKTQQQRQQQQPQQWQWELNKNVNSIWVGSGRSTGRLNRSVNSERPINTIYFHCFLLSSAVSVLFRLKFAMSFSRVSVREQFSFIFVRWWLMFRWQTVRFLLEASATVAQFFIIFALVGASSERPPNPLPCGR